VQEEICAAPAVVSINGALINHAYRPTLHINDTKKCSLGVDDNRTIFAIDGNDLGCGFAGTVKLRASQVHAFRGFNPAIEVNDTKSASGHEP
jgi:hypothetical protein